MKKNNYNAKLAILRNVFKHENFRGKQEEAVHVILEGNVCLVVLPTGSGKTVYVVPALMSTGTVTMVICPLLSLMVDQVTMLRSKGLIKCMLY